MILSFFCSFVSYLTYDWLIDWFGTVLRFYVLYYCIIILCFSYLATWLPFLNIPIDWLIDWLIDTDSRLLCLPWILTQIIVWRVSNWWGEPWNVMLIRKRIMVSSHSCQQTKTTFNFSGCSSSTHSSVWTVTRLRRYHRAYSLRLVIKGSGFI